MTAPNRMSSYILPTATTMVGIGLMVISVVKMFSRAADQTLLDEVIAMTSVGFLVSALSSYVALRRDPGAGRLRVLADWSFIARSTTASHREPSYNHSFDRPMHWRNVLPGWPELVSLSRGVDGLEHVWFFVRAPAPSVADLWLSPGLRASEFDVQFARPMIEHHSAALDMAMKYNTNPNGRNAVLGSMNTGIMVDQRYEIGFLQRLMARYPGNPAAVPDDPRMMEVMKASMSGMEGGHGSHHPVH